MPITDSTGAVAATYKYDPWGNITEKTGTIDTPFGYRGKYGYTYDKETGLYFLKSRYYDPETGRFTQKDRFAGFEDEPASQHPYIYCENDPVNKQDADGEVAISIPGVPGLPLIDSQTMANFNQACRDLSWMIPSLYNEYVAPTVNNLLYPSTRAYNYGTWNWHDPDAYNWAKDKERGPKPPGYGNGWTKQGQDWVSPQGIKWRYHPEDKEHYEHWDKTVPGRGRGKGKTRVPIGKNGRVFKSVVTKVPEWHRDTAPTFGLSEENAREEKERLTLPGPYANPFPDLPRPQPSQEHWETIVLNAPDYNKVVQEENEGADEMLEKILKSHGYYGSP